MNTEAKLREALESARNGLACMSEYIAHKELPFTFKDSVSETERLVAEALALPKSEETIGNHQWRQGSCCSEYPNCIHAPKSEEAKTKKAEAILDAIRKTDVGSEIIIHNEKVIWLRDRQTVLGNCERSG